MIRSSRRGRFRVIPFVLIFTAVACGGWWWARRPGPDQRCAANLKTLVGAGEMYALDR